MHIYPESDVAWSAGGRLSSVSTTRNPPPWYVLDIWTRWESCCPVPLVAMSGDQASKMRLWRMRECELLGARYLHTPAVLGLEPHLPHRERHGTAQRLA